MSSDLSQIGANFIVGLSGEKLLPQEKTFLGNLKPLGIILFAKNIAKDSSWITQLQDLIKEAKEITENENLIVSIDHEGGKVHRFSDNVTKFPAAKKWREESSEVARAMALELGFLGFNLNFAPVADIHSEEKNPVIGDRAFSQSPDEVAKFAEEFYKSQEKFSVLACAKHFPGHGATVSDSHLVLPKLELSLEKLEERELIPFKSLIDSGISLVMTAHVMYPLIDPVNPATLSSLIIRDILRNQLKFKNVVITDDLEMKALDFLSPEEKAVKAIQATVDILLEANPSNDIALNVADKMAKAILDRKQTDTHFEKLLNDSHCRIAKLTQRLKTFKYCTNKNYLASSEHHLLAERLIRA